MCQDCVSSEVASRIELVQDIGADFPDGAFWALAEENGLDATDFEAYYKKHDKVKKGQSATAR